MLERVNVIGVFSLIALLPCLIALPFLILWGNKKFKKEDFDPRTLIIFIFSRLVIIFVISFLSVLIVISCWK
jgi:hypothetical protein